MDYNDHSSFNGFFNWTATYRWDSDFPIPYGWISPSSKPINGDAPSNDNPPDLRYPQGNAEILNQIVAEIEGQNKQHRKLVAWMVSNCETNSERELYVQQLQEFIDIDVFGKCGPLECHLNILNDEVSISPTCYNQRFCMKLLTAAFLYFLVNEIGEKGSS